MKKILFFMLFFLCKNVYSQTNLLDKNWVLIGQEFNAMVWNIETKRYGDKVFFYFDKDSITYERPNFIWFYVITLKNENDFSFNSIFNPNSLSGIDCNTNEFGFGGKTKHPDGSIRASQWFTINDKPIFLELCNQITQRKPLTQSEINLSNPKTKVVTTLIDDAKKKCSDLGFKSGTERFGKCVLQLSK